MTISRASMQQQLKGNKMKVSSRTRKNIRKAERLQAELDKIPDDKYTPRSDRIKIIQLQTQIDNLTGMRGKKAGGHIKKKPQKKNVGGFLETFSPAYSVAKGRGPISDALSALGPVAGLSGLAAREQKKKREKQGAKKASKANMASGMQANMMPGADRMAGGGKVVMSKRTRSIDGIATKGKTRATQR